MHAAVHYGSVCLAIASAVAAATGPQQTGLLSVNATGEFTTRLSVAVLASSDTGGGRGGATGTMTPLSLATADLNHDGYPDLIVGYAAPNGGLLKIHFANPQAFAPDSAELVQEIAKGQFPPTFLNSVSTIPTSAAPDLLAAGDFSGTGAAEILYATRGGSSLIRLAADSIG